MKRAILTTLSIGLMPVLGYGQFPPVNAAVGTWMMHHGSTSLSGLQLLKGAVTGPDLKCTGSLGGLGSEGDPAIADINGDGLNEIVILTYYSPTVYAFRGTDCTLLWLRSLGGGLGWGTPAVGELDPSRPGLEIVVGTSAGTIYALSGTDGSIIWSRAVGVVYSPVTIADVDGDGVGEVFVVGNNIYSLRGTDGSVIWSRAGSSVYANVAIGDINLDGQYEVLTVASNTLYALRATDGMLLWNYSVGSQGNIVLADLDNDGYLEVVVGTENSGNLYAIRYNGTLYWSRSSICGSSMVFLNSPTAADINGDGMIEVLFGCRPSFAGYVYALRGTDGSTIWTYSGTFSGYQTLGRKIGDIDNDGEIEIIVSGASYGPVPRLVVLRGTNGSVKWTYNADYFEGVAIGDVDNDGCIEVVLNGDYSSSTFYIFDSPTPVSDCGILGYDDPVEDRNIGGVYLLVSPVKGGVNVETGRRAFVEIYTTDGRKVKGLEVDRSAFVELKKGIYIFRVKGHNLYRTVIVR
jgi:outer membrane protein assembly factor BamB